MTSQGENDDSGRPELPKNESLATPSGSALRPLPGVAAVALYMLLLSGTGVVGVVKGDFRPTYLVLSAAFMTASMGLLLSFRWAWTLTLAAVVLLMGLFVWRFSTQRDFAAILQGLLNLVIFLYLVRPEVRARLR